MPINFNSLLGYVVTSNNDLSCERILTFVDLKVMGDQTVVLNMSKYLSWDHSFMVCWVRLVVETIL